MHSLEAETLLKAERIKAKAAIAVAILNKAGDFGINNIFETKKEKLIELIKEAQKTIDE